MITIIEVAATFCDEVLVLQTFGHVFRHPVNWLVSTTVYNRSKVYAIERGVIDKDSK